MDETVIVHDLAWLLTSLSTAGLVIVVFAIVILALAKFGVITKIIDAMIAKKHISTGMNKQILNDIQNAIERLLGNGEDIKDRITTIEINIEKNTERMDNIEKSQYETMMENYKAAVFNEALPLIDRMAVGIKFMLNNGNSDTKAFLFNDLAQRNLVIWNGLCKAMKAHQFWQHKKEDG